MIQPDDHKRTDGHMNEHPKGPEPIIPQANAVGL